MNNILVRSNTIFAFTLSILASLTLICAFSTAFKSYGETVYVKLSSGKRLVKRVPNFSTGRELNDLGFITFNLEADFTKTFDWNTKQLFLYLTAHYKTKANINNEVILWDYIMLRGDNPKINLKDHNTKYYFWDDGSGLQGNSNITLTLSMNVIPNSGLLPFATSSQVHSFTFPSKYVNYS